MKLISIVIVVGACTTPTDSFVLDHTEVLAVRAEPAHVAPGGTVRIDALVATEAGDVAITVPEVIETNGLAAERRADGWYVTGPDAPLAQTIAVTAQVDGVMLVAQKELLFGDVADNPAIAALHVDGDLRTTIEVAVGAQPTLDVGAIGVEPLTFAWYASVGSLEHFRRHDATFVADMPGDGIVCVVVRDAQGGVAWQTVPTHTRQP